MSQPTGRIAWDSADANPLADILAWQDRMNAELVNRAHNAILGYHSSPIAMDVQAPTDARTAIRGLEARLAALNGNILDHIDRATANLCPCGAQPREGSAYCSDDCTPTHRSVYTTSDSDGTQMRWRPDLVSAADDTDLTSLGGRVRSGSYWRETFTRDASTTHLRVDDGHRFVGADIASAASPDEYNALWSRLEREFGDARRTVPGDPWADVMPDWAATAGSDHGFGCVCAHTAPTAAPLRTSWAESIRRRRDADRERVCAWLRANDIDPNDVPDNGSPIVITGESITVEVAVRDTDGRELLDPNGRWELLTEERTFPLVEPWPDGLTWDAVQIFDRVRRRGSGATPARTERREFARGGIVPPRDGHSPLDDWDGLAARIAEFVTRTRPIRGESAPAHPMQAVIEARRNRNTGPQQRARAPRAINPRRGR